MPTAGKKVSEWPGSHIRAHALDGTGAKTGRRQRLAELLQSGPFAGGRIIVQWWSKYSPGKEVSDSIPSTSR